MESAIPYSHILQSAPDLYLILSPSLHILTASNAYCRATMTNQEQIRGKFLFEVFPDNPNVYRPSGATNLRTSLEQVIITKSPQSMQTQKYDVRRPDGSFEEKYWSPLNIPVLNETGELLVIIHKVEDVTDIVLMKQEEFRVNKKFEEKIRQINVAMREEIKSKTDELTAIVERITDGFIALDSNFRYIYANKKIRELTGKDPVDLIGKNVWEEFPQAVGSPTYKAFLKAMNEQRYICNSDYYPPFDLWQENHIYPSKDGLSVFIRDITERKKAEQKLQHSRDELRQLASHLQYIREEEQRRIAREVHDELGQQITGLKMDVSWIRKKLSSHNGTEVLQEKLEEMSQLLDTSVQTVRRISSDLRPAILDDMGVVAALEWQSSQFQSRFGIPTKFESSDSFSDLSLPLATGLFRLYQESLTNIARHAEARTVFTSLRQNGDQLVLTVHDDGKGFDLKEAARKRSLGILGMRERVLMMSGELDIISEPGNGTTVTVTIPYTKA